MVSILSLNYLTLKYAEIGWKWQGSKAVRDFPQPQEILMKLDTYIEKELHKAALQIEANVS
jgi:hypothetical protein